MEAVLLRRPVEGISRNDDAWSGSALKDHHLDDFAGYPDAAVEIMPALLCEKHETPKGDCSWQSKRGG
jgi:hypothetical protein